MTIGSIQLIHVQDDVIMRSIKRQLPGLLPPLSPGAEPEDPAAACNCRKVGLAPSMRKSVLCWLPDSCVANPVRLIQSYLFDSFGLHV